MGIDFKKTLDDMVKGVTDFVDRTGKDIANALDQNGDGNLDLSDIQTVLDRNHAAQAENRRKAELERLKPLFPEDFDQAGFVMPKMICVDEIDKPHAESEVCKGSVGFNTVVDNASVITIYNDHVDDFGLIFFPALDNGVYYADPCDKNHYIALDQYFNFMKTKRVAELQRIAQSLGAKHFRVTLYERSEAVSSDSVDVSVKTNVKMAKTDAKVNHAVNQSSMYALKVEAESSFPGHDPIRPETQYLKNDINISNLIEMRMDPVSPLQHQHFNIELSESSGIRVKDAVKIAAMLKKMGSSVSTTVLHDAQQESRRVLEYEIDF